MKSSLKFLVAAGLLAGAGFSALAQPPAADTARTPMIGASGAMRHGGPMGMRGKMDPAKMEAMMAKRHAALKTKLKLSAEQEPAWTTFTSTMKPPSAMAHKRPDRAELDKLSTPERIDKMRALRTQRMAAMNAEIEKREDAAKAFYATLSAEQKKVFDAEHARMGGRHGEHRGHGAGKGGADKPAAK